MTGPKVAGKSQEGRTRYPRGKFPIYSSLLPNAWEPIKRMNGIVAVAAMLRAALGVHEIRAHRPHFLFFSLSLLFLLSNTLSFFLFSCPHTPNSPFSLVPQCALYSLSLSYPRIETPLCRMASGITMNLHSLASNSEHIALL